VSIVYENASNAPIDTHSRRAGAARMLLDRLGGGPGMGNRRQQGQSELSEVVQTIARYEPVRVLACRGQALREARLEFASCPNVTVIEAPVDDIWMRDILPTFALRSDGAAQEVVAIDWNFNGWGGTRDRRPRAGDQLAKTAASIFGVPRVSVPFVAEGAARSPPMGGAR
jgi:agmatine/peptidylarginine deiminase